MEPAPNNASTQFTLQRLLVSMVVFSVACAWAREFLIAMQGTERTLHIFSPFGIGAVAGFGIGWILRRQLICTFVGAIGGWVGFWFLIIVYNLFLGSFQNGLFLGG